VGLAEVGPAYKMRDPGDRTQFSRSGVGSRMRKPTWRFREHRIWLTNGMVLAKVASRLSTIRPLFDLHFISVASSGQVT
jgi:hypothetical protein